ncbi:aminotransferase class I/II-fold pyridoxal phosphate-dependent enzyme [Erysipelotrichaceae bacterium OttesenSCG-928-M19]|nr:aminotransferase class I/II-fold pyridoxal phosphate-dependent enzyme [Erysipelotrichaceae bacterium OttesenSCG-928-M19]
MRNDLKSVQRYIAPPQDIINLANNENYNSRYFNLLKKEFTDELKNTPLIQYGPATHEHLVEQYAKYIKKDYSQIMSAPGSDSLIAVLINALTTKSVLVIEQDFFRYQQVAKILNREIITIKNNENLYQEIVRQSMQNNVELIFLSNPNNPLGIRHDTNELLHILKNTNCYVVIDEAYYEYQKQTMIDFIEEYDRLIILRTMSKAWGLAGLRVGFAITNKKLIDYLLAIQGPFTLSSLNANLATCTLKKQEIMQEDVIKTINEKQKLINFLNNYHNIKIYDSYTNFVYIEVANALEIKEKLQQNERIAIASFPNNGLRITIGNTLQMKQLYSGLKKYLKG